MKNYKNYWKPLLIGSILLISFNINAQIRTSEVIVEERADVLVEGDVQVNGSTQITGNVTASGPIFTSQEISASNTYKIVTISKSNVTTNATTNLCQSSTIGMGVGGMLKVTIEMKGDASHDQNCESIWYVPYRRGRSYQALKTNATKISEITNIVTVNLNSTVSGNTLILSVSLGNYSPNHSVSSVTLKIEQLDKNLTWTSL